MAACLVLGYHTWGFSSDLSTDGIGWLLSRALTGVPIFFAISGFVLYRPFLGRGQQVRFPSIPRYARHRLLRIAPAYWVVATVTVLFAGGKWFSVDTNLWSSFLFVQTLDHGAPVVLEVAWTLTCEVMFYAILPVFAFATRRFATPVRVVLLGMMLAVGVSVRWLGLPGSDYHEATLLSTSDLFAVGMIGAVVAASGRNVPWLVGGTLISVGFVLQQPFVALSADGSFLHATAPTFVAAGSAALLTRATGQDDSRVLRSRPAVLLGTISYGIYLIHYPVARAIAPHVPSSWPHTARFGVILPLTFAATAILAGALWRYVESPSIRLARRLDAEHGAERPHVGSDSKV